MRLPGNRRIVRWMFATGEGGASRGRWKGKPKIHTPEPGIIVMCLSGGHSLENAKILRETLRLMRERLSKRMPGGIPLLFGEEATKLEKMAEKLFRSSGKLLAENITGGKSPERGEISGILRKLIFHYAQYFESYELMEIREERLDAKRRNPDTKSNTRQQRKEWNP
ncbi:MAG: hypothetical protein ABIH20_03890 [Candidatus Diapherotrites archaeon]